MTEVRYCIAPECDPPRPVAGHGKDLCSTHMKQMQRRGRTTAIAEKVSIEEQIINAFDRMANAEEDSEYHAAKKACIALAKRFGSKELETEVSELRLQLTQSVEQRRAKLRRALARARANGVRLGRPPKVPDEELARVFEASDRNISRTARVLQMAVSSVYERLFRKKVISERRARRMSSPRLAAECA